MIDASPIPGASPGESRQAPGWADFSVLVVDDEAGMRSFLARALSARACRVETAESAEAGAAQVARQHFDLVVLDIALPGRSGIEWLKDLREGGFAGDVILITAFADMETAINALRAGAADFILKPFRLDQIVNAIARCVERTRLARENYLLRRALAEKAGEDEGLVGQSDAMVSLRQLIKRLAPLPSTILLQGESGVGKEVAARALHSQSPRASQPFVAVNCGAIAQELIESELFGHVKGAFTGANDSRNGLFFYAHGGTLFLDEVGELSGPAQTKLLRVLEERRIRPVGSEREVPVDVRVVAATNRDLAAEVQSGRFRRDLYFRLEVMTLSIPPLRERREDIPLLARHFMHLLAPQLGLPPLAMPVAVVDALLAYPWPGNVRELKNYLERSLILAGFPPLSRDSTLAAALGDAATALRDDADGAGDGENGEMETLAAVEKRHILRVLGRHGGNKTRAAQVLGVSRKTLERKCAEWGIGGSAGGAGLAGGGQG